MAVDSTVDTPPAEVPRRRRWPAVVGILLLSLGAAGSAAVYTYRTGDAAVSAAIVAQLAADSTATVVQPVALSADDLGDAALAGEAAAMRQAVRAFYAARAGAPAWTNTPARDAALGMLAQADRDGLRPDVALPADLSDLAAQAGHAEAPDSLKARLDVRLTAAVLHFGEALRKPSVDAAELYGSSWTPATLRAANPDTEARALAIALDADPDGALEAFADRHRPPHAGYRHLRAALTRELALAADSGLVLSADVGPGSSPAAVRQLRARLAVEGVPADTARTYDWALEEAVRRYQEANGIAPTGRIDAATRDTLNLRRPDLIPSLVLNLERWRWLPDTLGDLHVFVNLPSYVMSVQERTGDDWAEVFQSRVVVGKPSWATPVFSDTMETVVFNPTWTMPASIQRESYGYVRPGRSQPPGPRNALGRVKFLFPNDHAVYFHDTPSKWGFTVERRALSHGCVRSGDPRGLAEAILTRTNGWSVDRVDEAMTGPWRTQNVRLTRPVPVHLVYFTAVADAAGRVTVYDDVYGRDARLAEALGLTDGTGTTTVAATRTATPLG